MKDWNVSIGSDGTHLGCEEAPWYIFLLDHFAAEFCCTKFLIWKEKTYTFHDIPLPKWPKWTDEDFGETSPESYWGDLGGIINYCLQPLWRWCWEQKKHKSWSVPVPWQLLKPHVPDDVKWVEESIVQSKQWAEEEQIKNEMVMGK